MTEARNPALDPASAGLANPGASISVGDINIEGNVDGNIVIGNNNQIYDVKVHNQIGAVFNFQVEPVIERHKMIPQPPRPPRGFIGRGFEQEALKRTIVEKEATFVYGHDGLGKTSLIKQVANSDISNNMPDGVIYLESVDEDGNALGFHDVLQLLFEALYLANPPLKASFANAKTHLSNTVPLVILDGFDLPATAFDKIPDLFPHGALLVASQNLLVGDDAFRPYLLSPLLREDAIQLFTDKAGIPATTTTLAVIDRICELCGDVPLALTKLSNIIQRKDLELSDVLVNLENIQPPSRESIQASIERSFGVVYSLLNDSERNALALVAAAPGISVDRQWLESATQDQFAVTELEALELIQANSPRMRMAEGLRQIIHSRPTDFQSYRGALLAHLLRELRSRSVDFDFMADELGNILGLLDWAVNENRWADVIALGRAVDPYLTLQGLWDAWETVLKQVLQAGQNLNDQAVQAWALHQLGSREIGVGSRGPAVRHLVRALQIREALGDKAGAAYTRHNLNIILPPGSSEQPDGNGSDSLFSKLIDSIRYKINEIRESIGMFLEWCLRQRGWLLLGLLIALIIVVVIILLMLPRWKQPPLGCPMPEGWQVYTVQKGDTLDSISERVASAMDPGFSEQGLPVIKLAIKNANFNCPEAPEPPDTISTLEPEIDPEQKISVPEIPEPPIIPVTIPPEEPSVITLDISTTLNGAMEVREVDQEIEYIYNITNSGSRPLEGELSITDNKVIGITCPEVDTVGNLDGFFDPEERATCTATYDVVQADIDYGSVRNVATAHIGEIVSNEEIHTVDIIQIPGLEISKQADPTIYTQVGQEIIYTYTVLNSGNVTLSPIQIFVNDDHIQGGEEKFPCEPETSELAPGKLVTCNESYIITQADMEARSVTNVASASVSAFGYNFMDSQRAAFMGNQVARATVNYADPPALELTVSADTSQPFDTVGQGINYRYLIKNTGGMPLAGPATITDDKAATTCAEIITVGNLDANLDPTEEVTCTGTYAITQADLDTGAVTNNSTGTLSGVNSNTVPTTVIMTEIPGLTLTKTANPTSYSQTGQIITYTYVIINSGNVSLDGPFSVSDNKIAVNCTQPNDGLLSPDEEMNCTAVYTITQADLVTGQVTNNASASNGTITSANVVLTINFSCPPVPAGWVVYVIQSGDTLFKISMWYTGITADRLMQANCLSSTNIRIGQNLYVPGLPPRAKIYGIVFSDPNRNNYQDGGELGVPNTLVALIDLSTNSIIDTETTDANGNYTFFVSKYGDYQIFQDQIKITDLNQVEYRKFGVSPAN